MKVIQSSNESKNNVCHKREGEKKIEYSRTHIGSLRKKLEYLPLCINRMTHSGKPTNTSYSYDMSLKDLMETHISSLTFTITYTVHLHYPRSLSSFYINDNTPNKPHDICQILDDKKYNISSPQRFRAVSRFPFLGIFIILFAMRS